MRIHVALILVLCFLTLVSVARTERIFPAGTAIALLKAEDNSVYDELAESFRRNCAAQVDEYNMRGSMDSGYREIARINGGPYDLIVAVGALAALVAKERSSLPVVFCGVFAADRKRLSGRNITGITLDVPASVQFTMLKKMMPRLRSIGVIYNPRITSDLIGEAVAACAALRLQLETRAVNSPKEVTWAVRDLIGRVDAQWLVPDNTVVNADNFRYMLLTSIENKLPLMAFSQTFVREGALASVSATNEDIGAEVARMTTAIRGGQPVTSFPVSSPKRSELFINLKTARALGFSIPLSVLTGATVYGGGS